MKTKFETPRIVQKRVRKVIWETDVSSRKLSKQLECGNSKAASILYDKDFYLSAKDIRKICIHYRVNPAWLLGLDKFNL